MSKYNQINELSEDIVQDICFQKKSVDPTERPQSAPIYMLHEKHSSSSTYEGSHLQSGTFQQNLLKNKRSSMYE